MRGNNRLISEKHQGQQGKGAKSGHRRISPRRCIHPVDTDRIVGGSKLLGDMRDLIRRKHYSIRNGKGAKDRVTLLPPDIVQPIRDQMRTAGELQGKDLAAGLGEVYLPYALERKYPNAARQWGLQYLFPAGNTAVDPSSGKIRRHHLGESAIQRQVKKAIAAVGIHKHGSCHTLRLVCVRYKYDEGTRKRYTTVKLIEEESAWVTGLLVQPKMQSRPSSQRLAVRVEYWETELQEKVMAVGGIWRPRQNCGRCATKLS
jgi:hypothetical protein